MDYLGSPVKNLLKIVVARVSKISKIGHVGHVFLFFAALHQVLALRIMA